MEIAPVEDWEVETSVISECYIKNIRKLTFFPNDKKEVKLNLSYSEAFAINKYYSATSSEYNILIRMFLEPKLPVCRS